ncbi:MAG: membrane dipeptidase [Candidatus Zixiibacteriota bacterium]|nr:MAG: membrane dipeptidase [candidate division Zixibacteria bacterium]
MEGKEYNISNCSRRQFLRSSLYASTGLLGVGPVLSALACGGPPDPLPSDRFDRRVLADLHIHSLIDDWNRNTPLGIRYPAIADFADRYFNRSGMNWRDCHAAGIDLICAAHFNVFDEWLSMPTDSNPEAPTQTFRMMDHLEEELSGPAEPYARLARNRHQLAEFLDIPKDSPEYRVAVVHTVEGGHALGGSIYPLEKLASRGVAMLDITHFFSKDVASAANSFPFFPDANSRRPNLGLSEFGREVVCEMERLGMIVDVTHATATAVEDVLDVACRPIAVSHGASRTLAEHPYSLYDEHIQEIVARGGIFGVILDPYLLTNYANVHYAERSGSLRDVVRMVRHLVKLCGGHEHIAIGSDFAGYTVAPSDMPRLSYVHRLTKMLKDEFEDRRMVEDIMANNAIDFLMANWKTGG